MDNSQDGIDTLRHLFVLLLGLGARESSGRYCEGRDMSAEQRIRRHRRSLAVSDLVEYPLVLLGDPAVAGRILGQSEWIPADVPERREAEERRACQLWFGRRREVSIPEQVFAGLPCFVTGIGLRYLRQHWGPINRQEVEIKREADAMLLQVQHLLSEDAAENPDAMA